MDKFNKKMLSPRELLAEWENLDEETLDINLDELIEIYAINRPSVLRQSDKKQNDLYKGIAY